MDQERRPEVHPDFEIRAENSRTTGWKLIRAIILWMLISAYFNAASASTANPSIVFFWSFRESLVKSKRTLLASRTEDRFIASTPFLHFSGPNQGVRIE
jgi:hypothetical protein